MAENWFAEDTEVNYDDDDEDNDHHLVKPRIVLSPCSSSSSTSLAIVKPIVCLFQDNQATSIKLNSFKSTLPNPVQSSGKIIAAAVDSSIPSASASSLRTSSSSSSPSINLLTDLQLKNGLVINRTPNGYYKIDEFQSSPSKPISTQSNGIDKEWCKARGRQLDDILLRLTELRKITKDETKEIQAMKDKTIRLIDTYSNIIVKTNEYLHKWDRKYGSIVKTITSNRYDGQEDEANYFYY